MTDRFWTSEEYDEQAHQLYDRGDLEGALETLKEGLALYPNAVELYVGLGYARLGREEFAWARAAFHQALLLDPEHEDGRVGLGEVLLRLGRQEQALQLFHSVAEMGFSDDVELMLTMGRALYREGRFEDSRDFFQRLASARPDSADAVASVGYALHRLGDEVGAARHLRRALRIAPDLWEARVYLGHILYERGDGDGALREFERIPPQEHWDLLALHRIVDLKAPTLEEGMDDPGLDPWRIRIEELDAWEEDPTERLLAEIEARVLGQDPLWRIQDESQLELFERMAEAPAGTGEVEVRLLSGARYRGSWTEVVRQMRDDAGFSHERLDAYMRRMAESWHEQAGIRVPFSHPERFLQAAAAAGLLRLELLP
jgi:Flp pilus assembly protein TadD